MIGKLEPLLYLITGPMYSAKTKELMSQIERYKYADCKYQLFKPSQDDRYSKTEIVTHKGEAWLSSVVSTALELQSRIEDDTQVIGIDEIMFFDSNIVKVCYQLRETGKVVIASGLDMNSELKPFLFSDHKANMGELFAIADLVDKRTALCQASVDGRICGAVARYTRKIGGDPGKNVEVGSKGIYMATCLEHHK